MAQAGGAGPAGQDRSGSYGGRLVGTAVLEQNVSAASAAVLPGDHHGGLALTIFCFDIDSIL